MKHALLTAALFVAFATPYTVSAAALTEIQIQSILNLLVVFGVDGATLAHVEDVLHNETDATSDVGGSISPAVKLSSKGTATLKGTVYGVWGKNFGINIYRLEGNIKADFHGGNTFTQEDGDWSVDFPNVSKGTHTVELYADNKLFLQRVVMVKR